MWLVLRLSHAPKAGSERQRDRETERQRDRETERQRDRETERQRDRETERQEQRDRETERQTERQRDRKERERENPQNCLLGLNVTSWAAPREREIDKKNQRNGGGWEKRRRRGKIGTSGNSAICRETWLIFGMLSWRNGDRVQGFDMKWHIFATCLGNRRSQGQGEKAKEGGEKTKGVSGGQREGVRGKKEADDGIKQCSIFRYELGGERVRGWGERKQINQRTKSRGEKRETKKVGRRKEREGRQKKQRKGRNKGGGEGRGTEKNKGRNKNRGEMGGKTEGNGG